jgi:hypothetical protein
MLYKNIEWKNYHGVLIPKTAAHIEVNLSNNEQQELLKQSKAYFLRYVSKWDIDVKSGFWYIIKDKNENLEQYKSKIRNQIKKGLKNCLVKKVTKELISRHGYIIYKNAFKNYNTTMPTMDENTFKRNILNSTCDFFAVYEMERERIIAYSQNIIENNSINYSTIKFDPAYLKLYPSYALFYEMNRYYLNEQKKLYVNDGAKSISHDTNIQEFLENKFNFRKAYCKLEIVYRFDIKMLVFILYPFKQIIFKINNKIFKKLSVLLRHEEIRRSYENN